jgi:low temperature requirement protein LtrA
MSEARSRRHAPTLRGEGAQVTPLELFFDLIFVLALTQCTALMARELSWLGVAKGLMILAALWWSWVGYAWLTSVVDPEEGEVRIAIFAAMAALLVAALCVPEAFGKNALLFASAYGLVRLGQIALFILASGDDPHLRSSVLGLAVSSALGVGPLIAAAFFDGPVQLALWALALLLDFAGPLIINVSGWRLSAEHFSERHGLIVIIALGESIVAIGAGAEFGVTPLVVLAAVLGTAVAASLWWAYFDVVALVSAQVLAKQPVGAQQNRLARDSFSYLHLPIVAGVVLVALGLKKVLGKPEEPLYLVAAAALFGGAALYFLALAAFRKRNIGRWNTPRVWLAVGLFALVLPVTYLSAILALSLLAGILASFIGYEVRRNSEARLRLRAELRH